MPRLAAALAAALVCALPSSPAAHEIPNDVTIQSFLKPEGQRLHLLVRVPLSAMIDIDYPKRGQGLLDLARADAWLRDAATLWIADDLQVYEGDTRLPYPRVVEVRASLAADPSFRSYEEALAHVNGSRLPDSMDFVWNQGLLDVLFEYPIQSDRSQFSIEPRFARLGIRTLTVLRFLPPGGAVRAFEFAGDPGVVRLDPRWYQASLWFIRLGFLHILNGVDYLLFLVCLVIPYRRLRALVPLVTAFVVAHSVTLIASAYDLEPDALWFPPLIGTLIAMSIVYMALENIVGGNLRRRWMVTFGFGLVLGFAFSFALRQTMQFAGSHVLASVLSFNAGLELGLLFVLLLLIPTLEILFRFVVAERIGTIIVSALVAHTGWTWMTERGDRLSQYRFEWPALTAALMVSAIRWMMLIVVVGGLIWLVEALRQPTDRSAEHEAPVGAEK
jgi:hypothetical protein